MTITRAIISVSDKSDLEVLARGLIGLGVEILSTGGTARALREVGLPVTDVSSFTGFPEILEGRVKTLHPAVHGGILHRRTNPEDLAQMKARGFGPIDMVVVNLYPFAETIAKPGVTFDEAIENIDIGGPCLLRAAAKNNAFVTVLTDSADYQPVLEEIKTNQGDTRPDTRRRLAQKAFAKTSHYDQMIADYLAGLN